MLQSRNELRYYGLEEKKMCACVCVHVKGLSYF